MKCHNIGYHPDELEWRKRKAPKEMKCHNIGHHPDELEWRKGKPQRGEISQHRVSSR